MGKNQRILKCSRSIFVPRIIRIMPPAISAFDLYFVPKTLPIFNPKAEIINVTIPMHDTAKTILTFKNASEIPTARASMLVAMARSSIDLNDRELSDFSSSLESASLIIFRPIKSKSINAIQWLKPVILSLN